MTVVEQLMNSARFKNKLFKMSRHRFLSQGECLVQPTMHHWGAYIATVSLQDVHCSVCWPPVGLLPQLVGTQQFECAAGGYSEWLTARHSHSETIRRPSTEAPKMRGSENERQRESEAAKMKDRAIKMRGSDNERQQR